MAGQTSRIAEPWVDPDRIVRLRTDATVETLVEPDQVHSSARFGSAKLFSRWYTNVRQGKHVVVVVVSERTPQERHWIIAAYLASKLAPGRVEWQRS